MSFEVKNLWFVGISYFVMSPVDPVVGLNRFARFMIVFVRNVFFFRNFAVGQIRLACRNVCFAVFSTNTQVKFLRFVGDSRSYWWLFIDNFCGNRFVDFRLVFCMTVRVRYNFQNSKIRATSLFFTAPSCAVRFLYFFLLICLEISRAIIFG